MSAKEAYKLAYMWCRLNVGEKITFEYWIYMRGLFSKNGFESTWSAADNSLRDRSRWELGA